MPTLFLYDRNGKEFSLPVFTGQTVNQALLQNLIPPTSVLTRINGEITTEIAAIHEDDVIEVFLIEKYNIDLIRRAYSHNPETKPSKRDIYTDQALIMTPEGNLSMQSNFLTTQEIISDVETKVEDTIGKYKLISPGDKLLLGLSGGVDSTSMMLSLDALRRKRRDFEMVCATIADYEITEETFKNAGKVSSSAGLDHKIVAAREIEEQFNLNTDLNSVYEKMMNSRFYYYTMYADHQFMRMGLERLARKEKINKIALALHSSDVLGGMLNGYATGHIVTDFPQKHIGDIDFVYPLVFIPKKELHLYHYAKTGKLVRHAHPPQWEFTPLDRNFYYYLGDVLQTFWPGFNYWVIPSNAKMNSRLPEEKFVKCDNCHTLFLLQSGNDTKRKVCDVCDILISLNLVK